MDPKKIPGTAAHVAIILLGARVGRMFLGDGQAGLRDMVTEIAGGIGATLLAAKFLPKSAGG